MPFAVEQRRGGLVETVHPVSVVVASPSAVLEADGPDLATFWRSGCKPVQLLNSLAHLPSPVVAGLAPEDLAVGASSHSGQPRHTERVAALLTGFGLDVADLRCGAHWPMHEPSGRALAARGERPTNLHSNCSGKHTFMLAAASARAWDPDYRSISHPLQQGNRALLAEWMGHTPADAVDGCSIPTFFAPLSAMGRAFARLATEMADAPDGLAGAMHHHPEYTSGDDRLDLAVVRGATRPLTVKVGAEGLFCVALPETRQALIVKVHTGNADALAVAVFHALNRHWPGILPGPWAWLEVQNVAGRVVGDRIVRE
jgi:L-asparaginase II